MTDAELKDKLQSIESRLNRLDKSPPGTVSGGDAEFFGQHSQLEELALKLEALIEVLEESHPGIGQTIEEGCRKAKSDEVANVERQLGSVFGDDIG